ncbi:RDD family protein [Luteimonas aestuarii]|uniref:RDD family protein n=1 Tax=Luteimonas aestuarii TaxID=453837 RepID=A0A4R5TTP6_9GAMM|nr:RDD family protein [Luteimonas aestuarii]TDK24379.1 RDD family protein [Luteimonas aestuarii]
MEAQQVSGGSVQADPDVRAWPRYFARMIDIFVFSFALIAIVVLYIELVHADVALVDRLLGVFEGVGGTVLSNVVSPVMAIVPVALLLACGQTPGKWLFGIRVRDREGRRIGFLAALRREAMIYVRGLGLGLPLVTLYTLATSFGDLKNEGTTHWDRALGLQVSHAPATWFWWVRATLGGALVLAMVLAGSLDVFGSMA